MSSSKVSASSTENVRQQMKKTSTRRTSEPIQSNTRNVVCVTIKGIETFQLLLP